MVLNPLIKGPCKCGAITTINVKSIQRQNEEVARLEAENKDLRARVANLEFLKKQKEDNPFGFGEDGGDIFKEFFGRDEYKDRRH
jgi:hypothetical protein